MQPIHRFTPSQKWSEVSATDMNRIVDAVNSIQAKIAPLNILELAASLAAEPHQKAFYKIVSNDGSGAYTIRRVFWSHSSGSFADVDTTHPEYSVSAKEFQAAVSGTADDIIKGWWVRADDAMRMLVDVGAGGEGTSSSPKDLLPTGANFETETAQTDTWDRGNQGANDGLKIRLQTRMAYNHAGDEKLYAYYREFLFDSTGNVKTISAETRKEIDAPDTCT